MERSIIVSQGTSAFINYIFVRLIYYISYSTLQFLTKLLKVIEVEILFLLYIKLFLCYFGDIELNPGHKKSSLTSCHWNLNSIAAHEFVKISLIQEYITERNTDILYLCETFLNSFLNKEDDRLKFKGHNLIRSDHFKGLKKDVLVYSIKSIFPLSEGTISEP